MRRLLAFLLAGCLALPFPAWAAISFISATGQNGTPTTGPLTVTIPTVSTDDYLLLGVEHQGAATPATTDDDSGGNTWTTLATSSLGGTDSSIYWKRATGSTSGKTITVTASGASCMAADLLVYRGVTTNDPPHEALSAVSSDATSHPAITTLTNAAHLLLVHLSQGISGTSSWLAGATPFVSGGIGTSGSCQATLVSVPWPTAGTSGTISWTGSPTTVHWAFAIKPIGAAGACVSRLTLLGVGSC